jgi:serine protease inhibitor
MLNSLKDESHITSPLSIFTLLSLAHKVSKETTFEELSKIVFSSNTSTESDVDVLLDDLKALTSKFSNIDSDKKNNINLSMINNFYTNQQTNYKILESYSKLMSSFGEIKSVNFNKPDTLAEINKTVEINTNGLIKTILSNGDINPDTVLVHLNCLYFKSKWTDPFEDNLTCIKTFTMLNGSIKELNIMQLNKKDYLYYEDTNYQMLSIPYQNNLFSFDVILPKASTTSNLNVDSTTLLQMLTKSNFECVNISIPKFEHEFELNVKEHLQKLGFNNIFTPNEADFSGITDKQLYISLIKHKAIVKVYENGTEAVATTAMCSDEVSFNILIKKPKNFIANHTFRYFIRFIPENMIIFSGQFNGQ